MLRDLIHSVSAVRGFSPASTSDNTAGVTQAVDRQGYAGVLFAIATGSIADADATFTVLLQESDSTGSGHTDVADADMISMTAGTAPEAAASFTFSDDDKVYLLDYIGNKRYLKLTVTPANNASAALWSVVALRYGARHNPAGVTQAP